MSVLLRVAELNAAYVATIDTDRLESWPDFFLEDCLYKITSADNHKRGHSAGVVYADSRAMLQDRVTALRTSNIYERQSYRHIVGLPVIGENGRWHRGRNAFPGCAHHARRTHRSVRHWRLSRQDSR